jgi:hypothetical protein
MSSGRIALHGSNLSPVTLKVQLAFRKMNSYLSDDDEFKEQLDDPEIFEATASLSLVVSMMENLDLSFAETLKLGQVALLRCERRLARFLDSLEGKEDGNFIEQKEAIRSLSAYWSTIFDSIEALSSISLTETDHYLENPP